MFPNQVSNYREKMNVELISETQCSIFHGSFENLVDICVMLF